MLKLVSSNERAGTEAANANLYITVQTYDIFTALLYNLWFDPTGN